MSGEPTGTRPTTFDADEVLSLPFDELPPERRQTVFGVDYAVLNESDGGQLFATRYGWPIIENLMPRQWYAAQQYAATGNKLAGSTGAVYRVHTRSAKRTADVVVKFCRFAQDVPLHIASTFLDPINRQDLAAAEFNGPFEEFGLVMDLRRGRYGPPELRIRTKVPLGIYAPAGKIDLWRTGRSKTRFAHYRHELQANQAPHDAQPEVDLDIQREYLTLFGWVGGKDAEQFFEEGLLELEDLKDLTKLVNHELWQKGFRVLDNKPRHFVLRQRPNGELMRRQGKLVYALMDFELLKRTNEYVTWLRRHQR